MRAWLLLCTGLLGATRGFTIQSPPTPHRTLPSDGVVYKGLRVLSPRNQTIAWENPGSIEMIHYVYPHGDMAQGFEAKHLVDFLEHTKTHLLANRERLKAQWDWPLPGSNFSNMERLPRVVDFIFQRGYEAWERDISWRDALEVLLTIRYEWVERFLAAGAKVPQTQFHYFIDGNENVEPIRMGQGWLGLESPPLLPVINKTAASRILLDTT